MGARREPQLGFGVFLRDVVGSARLAPVGAGTFDSAYTQAGPVPGHPVPAEAASRWRPLISGAQAADLTVVTLRGGFPGRERAAGVAYRLGTESAGTDYRGWEEPNLLTDWTTTPDAWGASKTWDDMSACVAPDRGHKVFVVARSSADGAKVWSYDPVAGAWAALYDFGTNPNLDSPVAIAYDEELSRLIVWSGAGSIPHDRQQLAYYSDDGGVTFNVYSRGQYDAQPASLRVAPGRGRDWLAFDSGTSQFASSDHGVTWELVQSSPGGSLHHPIPTSSGWVVAYRRSGDNFGCVKLLGSARAPFNDAAEVALTAAAALRVVGCRDYDGAIYVYFTLSSGPTQVFVSYDEGASFTEYAWSGGSEYALNSASDRPNWRAAVPAAGAVYCLGTNETDQQWHLTRFGGWSNVEQTTRTDAGPLLGGVSRCGVGSGASVDYVAWEVPDGYGQWTRLGSAGTRTLSGTDIGLQVACTQAQQEQYQSTALVSSEWASGAFCLHVDGAVPTLGGTAPTFNSGLFWQLMLDNGSNRYTAYIEIGRDGIRTHDGGTQRTSTAVDLTGWVHVRYVLRPGGLTVWARLDGQTKWTRIANDVTITAAATVSQSTRCTWGHNTAAIAGTTTWWTRYVHHSANASFRHGLGSVATSDDPFTSGVLGLATGRRVPGAGASYPVPDAASGGQMGYLTGRGGPTHLAEVVSLPAGYTYGLANLHPAESPSPSKEWRATGTDEVRLVYDQGSGQETWYGGALLLVALRANFRSAELGIDNGGGGWTTLGTLDKGWSSILYSLLGRSAVPRSGTATIDRYLHEDELAGGYLVCSTAGADIARRILHNSPGFWTTDSTVQRVRLTLEGVDGTESASGSGELVAPSGVLVVYPSTDPARRYLRIRIASGATVPGGYYGAGLLSIARLVGVGATPSWDWSRQLTLSRTTRRAAGGRLVVRRDGAPRTTLAYGWPDGCDLYSMRSLARSPDYVAASGGVAIGTYQDAWTSPLALIESAMASGEVPAVLLPALPAATGTITDPSLWHYGALASDGVGISSVLGKEGLNERLRVDSLAFESVP